MTERTWPVAGLSLILGFAVAEITDVRAIGGLVLVAAVAWCYPRWNQRHVAAQLTAVYLGAFAASHLLGLITGAWVAVALTAITVAVVTSRAENSV